MCVSLQRMMNFVTLLEGRIIFSRALRVSYQSAQPATPPPAQNGADRAASTE